MADTAPLHTSHLSRTVVQPHVIEVSPDVADALIALAGAVVFALAGGLLGAYLMLPFDIG